MGARTAQGILEYPKVKKMTKSDDVQRANDETRSAWNTNAVAWDARMADEGNDFVNVLCWPAIIRLLNPQPGQLILDAACGNGIFSRRIETLGAELVAFDFSAELIKLARLRTPSSSHLQYHVLDATDEPALLSLVGNAFDSILCNMALFDIADVEPLFRTLPKLLKPGGVFVFSLTHPAFNNASAVHMAEQMDDEGEIKTIYSVKISRYITPYHAHGIAVRGQIKPQVYFERPLQYYFEQAFQNGFVLDGFEECAFPPKHPQSDPLGWGGNFSEIPPVLVARVRLSRS
jgi:2-polyprenyl-3-methyl-5-hydroxy-6-metoxy-1,4-benzoquinol methylase